MVHLIFNVGVFLGCLTLLTMMFLAAFPQKKSESELEYERIKARASRDSYMLAVEIE